MTVFLWRLASTFLYFEGFMTNVSSIYPMSAVEEKLESLCSQMDRYQDGIFMRGMLENYFRGLRDHYFKIGNAAAITEATASEFIKLLEDHARLITPPEKHE